MKNQITFITLGLLAVAAVIFVFSYEAGPTTPIVDAEGKIKGEYSIYDIQSLDKPYKCTLVKEDSSSKIDGTVYINSNNSYADFRITSPTLKSPINSFLLVNDDTAYTWTSIGPLGFKAQAAKSAKTGASPQEQAQIIGSRDKENYNCEPWTRVDQTLFEVPGWVTFTDLNS